MNTLEAREALADIGASLSDQLTELANTLYEIQERRNQLNELWTARDYQALRDCGFLSARQLEAYQAACAAIEGDT